MQILIILALFSSQTSIATRIIWDNSVDFDSIDQQSRSEEVRLPNWFLIFPGTKWCGAGNIAEDNTDFGQFRDTDKCCRNHDFCPDIIEGYGTNHNLTNPAFYTRLNCKCDEEFHRCLKSVNSRISTQVGHLYFTVLNTKCFRKTHPIVSCKRHSYLPTIKCVKYEFDESQEEQYDWFDVPNY